MTQLVAGVLLLNLGCAAAGACALRAIGWPLSFADVGLALLVGLGLVGTLVGFAALAGAQASLVTGTAAIAAVAATGLLRRGAPVSLPRRAAPPGSATLALAGVIGAVCVLALVGGFRSSPWLDDAWGIWLAKAIALGSVGLDERLFVPNPAYVFFEVPDYPLWWPSVLSLDMQAVGVVDLRAVNAQLSLVAVAFVCSLARLLVLDVRPSLAVGGCTMVVAAPEFFRHAQGGAADLVLAVYLALALLCAALWFARGALPLLVLASLFAVVAMQVKTEALPELALLGAAGLAAAWKRGRTRPFAVALAVSLGSAAPWLAWRAANDVPSRLPLRTALSPVHLAERIDRFPTAAGALAERLLDPADWLVIVPLALVMLAVGVARGQRDWLFAALGFGALYALLVVVYWADRDELGFLLRTSAYRVVDPLVLAAAALTPLAAERLLRSR